MSVQFKPDKYNVQILSKSTSTTGRWILFLGCHYNGKELCYDLGAFSTVTGACKRVHWNSNKTGATIEYDHAREVLTSKRKPSEEDERDRFHIFGPDGRPTS